MGHSPLEQFTLIEMFQIRFGNYFLSFTNSSACMLLSAFIFLLYFRKVTEKGGLLVPNGWQIFYEVYQSFIASMVKEQIGNPGKVYFPFIYTVFTFVLVNNLIGLIPYSFTPTSHFTITMTLSCTILWE